MSGARPSGRAAQRAARSPRGARRTCAPWRGRPRRPRCRRRTCPRCSRCPRGPSARAVFAGAAAPRPRSAKPAASSACSSSVKERGLAGALICWSGADLGERDVQQQRRVDLGRGVLEVGGDREAAQDLVVDARVDGDVDRLDGLGGALLLLGRQLRRDAAARAGQVGGALGDLVQVGDHLRDVGRAGDLDRLRVTDLRLALVARVLQPAAEVDAERAQDQPALGASAGS